jgi:hypothetical protein
MPEPGAGERYGRQPRSLGWCSTWYLVLGAVVLLAALMRAQHPNLLSLPFSVFQENTSSAGSAVQWQRVRLRTNEDLERSFSVLIDLIEYPEHATSIRELTIDIELEKYCGEDELPFLMPELLSESEQRLTEAVKAIELGPELEKKIIVALVGNIRRRNAKETGTESDFNQACMISCYQTNRRVQYAEAVAILFCSLSPNLNVIRTTEPTGAFADFLTTINYRWASHSTSPVFANLTQVHLIDRSKYSILNDERFYRNSDPLEFIQRFHHLPQLATFSASTLSDSRAEFDSIAPGLSFLKKISVTYSDLSSQTMCNFIRLATSLHSVTFGTGGRATNDGGHARVFPKALGKCLEQHKATLRSIDLDLDQYVHGNGHLAEDIEEEDFAEAHRYTWDEENLQETLAFYRQDAHWKADEDESKARGYVLLSRDLPDTKKYGNTIGSFADFESLNSLKIGIKLLLGAFEGWGDEKKPPVSLIEMFPRSLTHLTIRGYKKGRVEEYDRHVEHFRGEMAMKLPALVVVEGLDEEVLSGETIDDPDGEYDSLYVEDSVDDDWLEVDPLS